MGVMADSRTPFVTLAVGLTGWLFFRSRHLMWKLAAVMLIVGMVGLAQAYARNRAAAFVRILHEQTFRRIHPG
jgi:hypothetical protein